MNWDEIKDNWKQVSDQIRLAWGRLSDEDPTSIAGERDRLASLIQQRYGYEKENAETTVDQFAKQLYP
jgi:uncharacterized protein YjbJ (UPF0337 family)